MTASERIRAAREARKSRLYDVLVTTLDGHELARWQRFGTSAQDVTQSTFEAAAHEWPGIALSIKAEIAEARD